MYSYIPVLEVSSPRPHSFFPIPLWLGRFLPMPLGGGGVYEMERKKKVNNKLKFKW
jgi:hypothetical protein